jgi:hypothetical protein
MDGELDLAFENAVPSSGRLEKGRGGSRVSAVVLKIMTLVLSTVG